MVKSRLLQEESRKKAGTSVEEAALFSKSRDRPAKATKPLVCHYCGKTGHIKNKCFKYRKDKLRNRSLLATDDAATAFFMKSSFFLDSGCSNHLCNDRKMMTNYRDLPHGGSQVTLANDESMTAEGIRDISVGGVFKFNKVSSDAPCEACLLGKQVALPFPVGEATRGSQPLQLIHSDVAGPMQEDSLGGTWSP